MIIIGVVLFTRSRLTVIREMLDSSKQRGKIYYIPPKISVIAVKVVTLRNKPKFHHFMVKQVKEVQQKMRFQLK